MNVPYLSNNKMVLFMSYCKNENDDLYCEHTVFLIDYEQMVILNKLNLCRTNITEIKYNNQPYYSDITLYNQENEIMNQNLGTNNYFLIWSEWGCIIFSSVV